jgi:threonine aldolase
VVSDIDRSRWQAALAGSTQILSGARPRTIAERLAGLSDAVDPAALPDVYGAGSVVAALEERVAGLLGAPAALFVPTGTMAQQLALRYGAELTGSTAVGVHPLCHLLVHERDAYAVLSGLRAIVTTTEPRNPTADEIAALAEPIGTLALELPLRDAGFVLPSWDELVAVASAARAGGIRVHLDGARLWESTVHLGHTLAEIAALADSTYVSFYKSLGGISGAALVGSVELIDYARAWRQRYGGMLFAQWPAALAALTGLTEVLPRLATYVRHAGPVAAALAEVARVHPLPPHTHQFQLWLPYPAAALNEAALRLAEEQKVAVAFGWRDGPVPGMSMAEITVAEPALELDPAAAAELVQRLIAAADEAS